MPQNKHHATALSLLLTPSWLSGLIAVIAGLVVAGGVIIAFSASNSQVQQQLLVWQQAIPERALTTPDQILEQNDKPTLQGSWPLLIFWSLLGLVVYTIATSITKSISNAEAFRESLDYVHADRHSMVQGVVQRIVIRLAIVGLWALFTLMFFKHVIPYSITAAHASAADVLSPNGIAYALISFLAIALSMHLHAIFLRLSFGKVRVLTSAN